MLRVTMSEDTHFRGDGSSQLPAVGCSIARLSQKGAAETQRKKTPTLDFGNPTSLCSLCPNFKATAFQNTT